MGYTTTATSKAGLTRKLKNLGYKPYDDETQIGFMVIKTASEDLWVSHHTPREGTMAQTLMANDYAVDQIEVADWTQHLGKFVETFVVYGKKRYI